ncbi:MAG: hypothetical protein IH585_19505 [Anaerolineaceae bacterium]|nr:hypothetical protein [Anaerolineaceae bacterium]
MVITILIFTIFLVVNGWEEKNIHNLEDRLTKLDIPVVEIKTISEQPFQIEITLQSASEDGNATVDDLWNLVMARRQANLASRIGLHLDSYTIHLIDTSGKTILNDTAYIYATDINQMTTGKEVKLDHEDSIRTVNQELDYGDLKVDLLDIFVNQEISGGGQTLILELSGEDIASINKDLPDFLHSLFRLFETEQNFGLCLAICHLRVIDASGTIMLDLVRDLESGISQWTTQPGVYDEWFPKPALAPTATDTSPLPLPGYPAPIENTKPTSPEIAYPYP